MYGSTEALAAALSLTGEQGKAFSDTLNQMKNSSGALDEAFKKQNETYDAMKQKWSNTIQTMSIEV